ncbi:MAG: hypothetical protein IPN09_00230 [Bacteroidetes bacterium]|nr:hypothetical protein [Bacteroidota bacterium]
MIWHGGDNVYDAGKKDIATLYEYWLFFTLLDLLKEVFEIEPKSIAELIQYDKDQLSLNLKQGTAIAMKGVYKSPSRNLNIQFSYNRSFGGGKTFPDSGSYTTSLRPDYTLSIWPEEITEAKDAERTELITHIHFDAKYKVKNFYELISKSKDEELTEEENIELIKEEAEEVKKGTFKNQDLLKMHAYKDAIRRTGGAYVLYPGEGKNDPFRGFHELIPGLGAFVIKPNKEDKDKEHLKTFVRKVIANFIDRASQREHTAIKVYDIHKDEKDDTNILDEPMPEYLDLAKKEKLIPDETFVLVAYYKSKAHFDWIVEKSLYNSRVKYLSNYIISPEAIGAKFILLYGPNNKESNTIFRVNSEGPRLIDVSDNIFVNYPKPSQSSYLCYSFDRIGIENFKNVSWPFSELSAYKKLPSPTMPFAVSLSELMKTKKK